MADGVNVIASKLEYLPADLDYIPDDLQKRAKLELFEDEDRMVRSLKELRTLLRKEQDLCWQDDDLFLLAFLRARKYDVERAFKLITGMYRCFGKHGRVFYNMDLDYLKRMMEENCFYFLPYRNSDGSVIVCFRYSAWDPDKFTAEEIVACGALGLLQALTSPSTQIAGFRLVVDAEGMTVKHVLRTRPSDLLFGSDVFENTVPMRVKGMHVVNQPSIIYFTWNIIKHFMSRKLRERVHFHGNDIKSLHQFVEPRILPADFGGELPEFDNKDWRQRMEASGGYIERLLSFGYKKYLDKDWMSGNLRSTSSSNPDTNECFQ